MDIDELRWSDAGHGLLEAVFARPESDEPRWVLADWLTQRGDPWGELMALQLARDSSANCTARITQLLEAHRSEWLAPFGGVLVDAIFERGFVHRCEVSSERPEDYAGRIWSTVRDLRIRSSPVERSAGGLAVRARGPTDFERLVWPGLDTFRAPCMLFQRLGGSAVRPWIHWLREASLRRIVLHIHAYTMDGDDIADASDAQLQLVRDEARVRASIRFPSPEPGAWADHPLDAYEAALEGGEVDWLGEVWGPE